MTESQAAILAEALRDCFVTEDGNVADALYSISHQLKYLGNGDAATPMGAMEAFGAHIGEKLEGLTEAIRDGLSEVSTIGTKEDD